MRGQYACLYRSHGIEGGKKSSSVRYEMLPLCSTLRICLAWAVELRWSFVAGAIPGRKVSLDYEYKDN